jgi:hypothetical protein
MRSWCPYLKSQHAIIFIFLILTSIFTLEPHAAAQTVTLNDSTVISNTARGGINIDLPTGAFPDLKNYYAFGNPGFEPVLMQQIFQFQGVNSNSSPTSFQWDVNNTQYEGYDPNQWAGATFSVIQGSYASGTSDPALGCTGTVATSTNVSGAGPIFTINPATNQGSNGCAGSLGVAGQVITVSTNNQMSNVFPTPASVWASGSNGTSFGITLQGGATVAGETTDLCATCGQQSLLLTVPAGGSVSLGGGPALNSPAEKTVTLNGTYTISFWAKSNAAVPPKVAFTLTPRSGAACTQNFSGSSSPAITSTWTQFSFNCSFAETPSGGGPYPFYTQIQVTPTTSAATSLEFDNISMVNTADSNPTPYTDAYVNALKAWCQSTANTTGPGCTLRYGGHPDSETMANWVKPPFEHQPTQESMASLINGWLTLRTNPQDFLTLCAYIGATPVLIFPSTTTPTEIQELLDFLEGPSTTAYGAIRASLGQATPWVGASDSPFSTIYLEFGNENWNGGFLGHIFGFNSSAPGFNGFYDYSVRANLLFTTARNYQTSQGYSQTATKLVLNYQTADAGGNLLFNTNQGILETVHPDAVEFNGYTAYNINSTSTTGCTGSGSTNATCPLYGPTLTEPWSDTHDPKSTSGFDQTVQKLAANPLCGPSGKAPCEAMVYEENTGTYNGSTAGPFTQAVSDTFTEAAVQGVITADQLGENDAAGISNQNYFTTLQYYFGEGGIAVHMWGTMLDTGGDCSMTNSSLFGGSYCPRPQMLGAQVYNWCKIGPMVQTSWTGNPAYNLPANNNTVNAINGVPVLRSFAFAEGSQRCMVVVNSDVSSSHQVSFAGTNAPTNNVTTYQFAPSALNTVNEMGALTDTSTLQTPMSNTTTPGVNVSSGYTLPPYSVTAFLWQANGSSTPTAATPTFSPAAGTYSSAQTVTISSSTAGATIYYTTNGSTPTTSSAVYSGPITVSSSETLQAIAVESGYSNSPVATASYTINTATSTLPAPTFSVAGGTYTSAQSVSISDATAGATIYYTTNGTAPTTSSAKYTGAITVSSSETLEAIAVETGYTNSSVATATYTLNSVLPAPTFSVAAGTYSSAQTVSISDATAGTTIYYTTNGTTPTTSSTKYSGAITVSSSETLEAIAVETGYTNSAVATATYTINSGSGTSSSVFNITNFANATSELSFNGNTTLDGTKLQLTNGGTSEDSSAWYSTPVNVSSFTTNFTFQDTNAVADGLTFTIQGIGTNALGSGGAGMGYDNLGQSVGLKFDLDAIGSIPESTGLYTDGAIPFQTAGSVNLAPSGINLASGDVMNVQLVYNGTTLSMTLTDTVTNQVFTDSFTVNIPSTVGGNTAYVGFTGASGGAGADQEILSWNYSTAATTTPALPAPTFSVAGGTYTSAQTVSISDATAGTTIYYTTNGTAPTTSSTKYTGAITVSSSETLEAIAVETGYSNSSVATATYTISSTLPAPTFSVAGGTYTSAQTVGISDANSGATIYYTTDGSTPTTSSTVYSGPITVSATETVEAIAVETGYTNSPVAIAAYTISGGCYLCVAAKTPTFSVGAGTYSSAQTVSISDATAGATIYYTTNGTTPTTSSTKYSSPITVSTTETLEAIAVATGYTNSPVASASYVIFLDPPGTTSNSVITITDFANAASELSMNGNAKLDGAKLQLTNGGLYEDSSTWYSKPVDVNSFTTEFTFQETDATADGFMFVIQGVGTKALGTGGAGLGFDNLGQSVGLKFYLHAIGSIPQSTGLYTDGAMPFLTTGSVNLAPSGINLTSGHVISAQLVYNGTTLALTLTDTVTGKVFTDSFTVNIPSKVGASTAYVGFTGASGGAGADQEILSWTYSN